MNTSTLTYILIGIAVGGIFIFFGTRNQIDETWLKAKNLLTEDILLLEDAPDKVQQLFTSIHGQSYPAELGMQLISDPFIPTKTFQDWEKLVNVILQQKAVVFSSVSGIGASTTMDRITKYICADPADILKVKCAPNFELVLHKEYIGELKDDTFVKGKLLHFLDACHKKPNQRFLLYIEDLDKINPESFWGPYLWDILEKRGEQAKLGTLTVTIPQNLHIVSVIHGTGKSLNNEHFRRMGAVYKLNPDGQELAAFLKKEKEKVSKEDSPKSLEALRVLRDDKRMQSFIYGFLKANEITERSLGDSYMLGSWSSIRYLYAEEDETELINTFINHINGLSSDKNVSTDLFEPIVYTLRKNGKLQGSSPIHRFFKWLEDKGFLTEFFVGLSFILASTLTSLYVLKSRGRILKNQMNRMADILDEYETNALDYDGILLKMDRVKKEVDALAMRRQINFEEANFFYQFYADKKQEIHNAKMSVDHFNTLLDTFMEDNVLTSQEYSKLNDFLHRIKPKIGVRAFELNKERIESLYGRFKEIV